MMDNYLSFGQWTRLKGAHMSPTPAPMPEIPAEEGRPEGGSTEVAPVTPETDLVSDNTQTSDEPTEPTTATENDEPRVG